jgi:hypothetical protein
MKTKILDGRFTTPVDSPSQSLQSKFTHCTMQVVNLHSPLFQNLVVYLYYTKKEDGKFAKGVKMELKEGGWGASGLIQEDREQIYKWDGTRITYRMSCTIQLRVGSVEKNGMKLPLPFPTHHIIIEGYYDVVKKLGHVDHKQLQF